MSYSEDLCEEILNLIFKEEVKIIKNYRPDYLKNPTSKRNLEYDFYLPEFRIAIEIQGEHHFNDSSQIVKDKLKNNLSKNVHDDILYLTLNQINIPKVFDKLKIFLNSRHSLRYLKRFDNKWLTCELNIKCKNHIQNLKKHYKEAESLNSIKYSEKKKEREKFLKSLVINQLYIIKVGYIKLKVRIKSIEGINIIYTDINKKEYSIHWKRFKISLVNKHIIIDKILLR